MARCCPVRVLRHALDDRGAGAPQLEFIALSDKTRRAVFADKAEAVVRTLSERFPNRVRPERPVFLVGLQAPPLLRRSGVSGMRALPAGLPGALPEPVPDIGMKGSSDSSYKSNTHKHPHNLSRAHVTSVAAQLRL
jgi:hypothetical protein